MSLVRLARLFHAVMTPLFLSVSLIVAGAVEPLHARLVSAGPPLPSSLIVGRAVCAGTTWLLTDRPVLIAVTHDRRAVTVRPVRGLQPADRPWGLACLTDGTLWTLATSRALVRLAPEAIARERIELRWPRLVLFGWLDRVLFAQLPLPIARPILASSPPRDTGEPAPWPKFFGRAAEARSDLLARNLINCGIGRQRHLPCWFADDRRVTVSDGASARSISFAALYGADVDASAPIWDLAIGGGDTLWLLVTAVAPSRGHKAGGRLVKTNREGVEQSSLQLPTAARTILSATDTTCVVLTVEGTLMEVRSQ